MQRKAGVAPFPSDLFIKLLRNWRPSSRHFNLTIGLDLTDFPRKIGCRVQFLQPGARSKARDRWFSVAGGKQDSEIGVRGKRRLGQFVAIHSARHHNVGKEHRNRRMSGEQTEGSRPAIGLL